MKVVLEVTDALLEKSDFLVGQGIRFGNDRDEVDFGMQSAHELDIYRFQAVRKAPISIVFERKRMSWVTHECPVGWMK